MAEYSVCMVILLFCALSFLVLLWLCLRYPNGGTNPPCTGCPIPKLTPNQTIPDFGPIRFEGITVLSAPKGLSIGKINCSVSPCHGIVVSDVRLVDAPGATPLACTQAHGTQDGNDPSAVHAGCLTPAVPLPNI